MTSKLPPKKDVAVALLEKSSVFIHLDPRKDQVVVPPWFKKRPQLVLQVGLNMAVPILDLSLDEECVSCTLSFNRSPFFCWIPWSAVYALVGDDGRGMVWPDDIPPEVAAQAQQQRAGAKGPAAAPQKPSARPARGHLRAVEPKDPAGGGGQKASSPQPTDLVTRTRTQGKPDAPSAADRKPPAEEERPPVEIEARTSAQDDGAGPDCPAPDGMPEEKDIAGSGSERADMAGDTPKKRKIPPYLRVVK